jgi:predicted RNase H-like HicB family nuclease
MKTYNATLPLNIWREEDMIIVDTPALGVISQGRDIDDAIKKFSEALNLYLTTAIEDDMLNDILEEYGWSKRPGAWDVPYQAIPGARTIAAQIPVC